MFKDPKDYQELSVKFNYQFHEPKLLARALTTKSGWHTITPRPTGGHQEELAFFGDGILRMVVDKILMREFPYYDTGKLSQTRDLLVKNANLITAAKRLNLANYIIMDANQARLCQTAEPKLLADTMEAIICAIYQDSKEDLTEVTHFIMANSTIANALREQRQAEYEAIWSLLLAIHNADLKRVQELCQKGIAINTIFDFEQFLEDSDPYNSNFIEKEKYMTPLGYAVHCLQLRVCLKKNPEAMMDIIEYLLKNNADVNLTPHQQMPIVEDLIIPLTKEGMRGSTFGRSLIDLSKLSIDPDQLDLPEWQTISDKLLKLFCDYGADLSGSSKYHTLLERAIIFEQKYKVETLLQHGAIQINTNSTFSALHSAAKQNNTYYIDLLLKSNADPNHLAHTGDRAFDETKDITIKKQLLKAELSHKPAIEKGGIEINELQQQAIKLYHEGTEDSGKFLQAALLFKKILAQLLALPTISELELMTIFYNLGSCYFFYQDFQVALRYLDRAYTLYLLNEPAIKDKTSKYNDRLQACKQKLEEKKNLRKEDNEWKEKNNKRYITADINNNSNQALFDAVKSAKLTEIKRLLMQGADPNAVSIKKEPLLHLAISEYNSEYIMYKSMVDTMPDTYGTKVSEIFLRSFVGKTFDSLAVIKLLLLWGANPNKINKKGESALHLATQFGLTNVIQDLLKYGADLEIADYKQKFPSQVAKDQETREFLLMHLKPKADLVVKPKNQIQIETPLTTVPSSSNKTASKSTETNSPSPESIKPEQSLSKTQMCRFFKSGSCKKGKECSYAHSKAELKKAHYKYVG